jgi:bacteriocin resistance YdeI/OmpD-like protein/uncharacterized protein DUF1905
LSGTYWGPVGPHREIEEGDSAGFFFRLRLTTAASLFAQLRIERLGVASKNGETPFHARLYKIGVNRAVDVPAKISELFGGGGFIPVQGSIEGIPITSTLVPRGNGRHRLFVHSRIWNRLKIEKGDFVEVLLTRGEPPKEPALPEDLAVALRMTKGAAEAYRQITSALRREFINWIENAKQPETRAHRIQKGLPVLMARARKRMQRVNQSGPTAKSKPE